MLPRPASAPARRPGAHALPRLRLTGRERRSVWGRTGICLAAGVALATAFPPFDVWPLAFVALVPLLWCWQGASPRRAAWYGFAFGVGFDGLLLEWTRYFGAVAIAPLVAATAAYVAATGALVAAFARRGVASPWLSAAVWVFFEGLMARWPLGGLPWGELGVSLHDVGVARSLASVGGVPLLTGLLVVLNALALDAAHLIAARWRARREPNRLPRPPVLRMAVSAVLLVAVVGVALVLRVDTHATGRVRFALLQGNDQNRDLTASELASQYLTRRHLTLASRLDGPYDLIVFPESALDTNPEQDAALRARLVAIGQAHGAVVLVNARTPAPGGGLYNSNLAYTPGGRLEGVYAKQHLVPFGEQVPLRSLLGFIGELRQVPFDYTAGHHRTLFRVRGHPFGTVICFESAFAPMVRGYVRDGAQLLVVTTNNRSYRRSGNAAQHLALGQMRAAETGRAVLQASISGISGVIDPHGRVLQRTELFVNAVTTGSVPTMAGETLAVRLGDWVLLLAGLAVLGTAAAPARGRVGRRGRAVDSAPGGASSG